MMPAEDWYNREVDRTLARQRMAVNRIVAAVIETCDYCGCALHRSGIAVAGGAAVIMATCPVCDRRDTLEDD